MNRRTTILLSAAAIVAGSCLGCSHPSPSPPKSPFAGAGSPDDLFAKAAAALGSSGAGPSVTRTSRKMTAAQAVAAATAFCRTAGIPLSQPGSAAYMHYESGRLSPPLYWKPTWNVRFGEAAVDVCDDDGKIVRYDARAGAKTPADVKEPSKHRPIPKALILAASDRLIAAAHVDEPLGKPQIAEELGVPSIHEEHAWVVIRNRMAQGYVMEGQDVQIRLDADTNAVKTMAISFSTPRPPVVKPVVSADQALKITLAYLKKIEDPRAKWTVRNQERRWINPLYAAPVMANTASLADRIAAPPFPALAWKIMLTDSASTAVLIPVDCVSGEVLKFGIGQSAHGGPPPSPIPPSILRSAGARLIDPNSH